MHTMETRPNQNLIRRLYDWLLHWAETPYGLLALSIAAFAESSFFPIPPDVLLIPLVLSMPSKWTRFAFWCTSMSVLGGMLGYYIGWQAWDTLGSWIMNNILHIELVPVDGRLDIPLPHYITEYFGSFLGGEYLFQVYDKFNSWIVFIFGLTPLPYKLVTISAGVAQINFPTFVIASIAARGLRFFVVAWIVKRWGPIAKTYIEKYFNLAVSLFVILLVGSFVLIKVILSD